MRPRPASALVLVTGFVLIAAGWAAIFAGWYQAARQELETGQLPYIVSGGFGGLGLLLLGSVAIVVHAVQRGQHAQHEAFDRLASSLERSPAAPALGPGQDDDGQAAGRRRRAGRGRSRASQGAR